MRPPSALRLASAVACLTTAALVAASCREPTQVTLVISTDLPCSALAGTSITVGTEAAVEGLDPGAVTTSCDSSGRIGSIVVVPDTESDGAFAVKVVAGKGMDVDDCVPPGYGPPPPSEVGCIVARRALRFIPHAPLTLPIDLRDACVGKPCEPGQTCVKGTCVSADLDPDRCQDPEGCDEDILPPVDDPPDAGVDAPVDAPADAADDAPACKMSPCTLVAPQCGCGPSQKCSHVGVGTTGCIPDGQGTQAELCQTGGCAAGFTCSGSQPQICRKYCDSDRDCPLAGSTCALVLKDASNAVIGFKACTDGCSALDNSGCPQGTLCHLAANKPADPFYVLCLQAGQGIQGAACTGPSDCAPKHFCVNVSMNKQCVQACDYDAAVPICPMSTACQALDHNGMDVVIGPTKYGVCF